MTDKFNFNGVVFDDYAEGEDGTWSQICQHCVDKHKIDRKYLDEDSGHGTCGVKGCRHEADHYIDFSK